MTTGILPRNRSSASLARNIVLLIALAFGLSVTLSVAKVRWQAVGQNVADPIPVGSTPFRVIIKGICQDDGLEATLDLTFLGKSYYGDDPWKKTFDCSPEGRGDLPRLLREWVEKFLKTNNLRFLKGTAFKYVSEFLKNLEAKSVRPDSP